MNNRYIDGVASINDRSRVPQQPLTTPCACTVFVGARLPSTNYYIGHSPNFGRVLIADLCIVRPLQRFSAHLCVIQSVPISIPLEMGTLRSDALVAAKNCFCRWISTRVLRPINQPKISLSSSPSSITPTSEPSIHALPSPSTSFSKPLLWEFNPDDHPKAPPPLQPKPSDLNKFNPVDYPKAPPPLQPKPSDLNKGPTTQHGQKTQPAQQREKREEERAAPQGPLDNGAGRRRRPCAGCLGRTGYDGGGSSTTAAVTSISGHNYASTSSSSTKQQSSNRRLCGAAAPAFNALSRMVSESFEFRTFLVQNFEFRERIIDCLLSHSYS